MDALLKSLQLISEGNIFQKYRICKTIRNNCYNPRFKPSRFFKAVPKEKDLYFQEHVLKYHLFQLHQDEGSAHVIWKVVVTFLWIIIMFMLQRNLLKQQNSQNAHWKP